MRSRRPPWQIFKDRGVEVEFQPSLGKDKEKLAETIDGFDGLAIRSATKVTAKILEKAKSLKVIGRAGIGVDNVDIPAATARGIIVMNTPFGNSITTAEHAITLMLALARQIPEADASTRAGKWEKNKFLGVEIFGKTLGIIGCGNIGSIVADRAIGLKMKVIAYDPFLSAERALDLGVEKVELDESVAARRLHHAAHPADRQDPQHHQCRDAGADEKGRAPDQLRARRTRRRSGPVRGAQIRPCGRRCHRCVQARSRRPRARCSACRTWSARRISAPRPREAQENVALQVAEQMSDYLLRGAISNAVNFPSISAEEAPKLKPFVALAEKLGSFAGQLTETGIKQVQITYEGVVAQMNTKALTSAAVAGLLRPMLQDVNVVSAPIVAKDRGIVVEETRREAEGDYESLITVTVTTDRQTRHVSGTVFADGRPRIVNIKGIRMDAEFGPSMIYITNLDKPGFIGKFSSTLGRRRHQYRDLPCRPRGAWRQRHRADRDRRRTAGRRARQGARACRRCSRPSRCGFDDCGAAAAGIGYAARDRLRRMCSWPVPSSFAPIGTRKPQSGWRRRIILNSAMHLT